MHSRIPRRPLRALLLSVALTAPSSAPGQSIVVEPYLQSADPSSIHVLWETDSGDESVVEWGPSDALGAETTGSAQVGLASSRIHTVALTGLTPDTRYFYRVRTGSATSAVYEFITPPPPGADLEFRLVAMSDMQRDWLNPDKYREVVEEGVVDFLTARFGPDLPSALSLVMVPGDLVDSGSSYSQWRNQFFTPGRELMPWVPFYPVPGNHEQDSPNFFKYFHLPDNGTPGYEEHWWYSDFANLRIVGLDSNSGYRIQAQLDWLDATLADACENSDIDFVFAQLHHPYHSELWTPGELDYTGQVMQRLELFSTDCGKPSIHFFGHTHGYSRGQSPDHTHLMVNVASAGGAIDNWGEFPQADYPEFSVSQDDWGFVLVEVESGAAPQFRMRRVSRGNDVLARSNEVRDDLTVRRFNTPPETPSALFPNGDVVNPRCVVLRGADFADGDGDAHGSSHWQIAEDCGSFDAPLLEQRRDHVNEYFGIDTQAGDDLFDEQIENLEPERSYCWRVRYRDRGLGWSDWSAPAPFETGSSAVSGNLLTNPGAEDGTVGWTVVDGFFESVTDGECSGVAPRSGARYFAVGGLCDSAAFAQAVQSVDVSGYAADIDDGAVRVHYGGWLRDWNGSDRPELRVDFRDDTNALLESAPTLGNPTATWTLVESEASIPAGARSADLVLTGTRVAGTDNDSYFDDLLLQLAVGEAADCSRMPEVEPEDPTPTPPDNPTEQPGCDCSTGGAPEPASATLLLALLVGTRKRRGRRTINSPAP